jgi:hypothetical protein
VPVLSLGAPLDMDRHTYSVAGVGAVQIFYPQALGVKEGFSYITIQWHKILFWGWLELKGARGIAMYL